MVDVLAFSETKGKWLEHKGKKLSILCRDYLDRGQCETWQNIVAVSKEGVLLLPMSCDQCHFLFFFGKATLAFESRWWIVYILRLYYKWHRVHVGHPYSCRYDQRMGALV